jgi:hypothetical protein
MIPFKIVKINNSSFISIASPLILLSVSSFACYLVDRLSSLRNVHGKFISSWLPMLSFKIRGITVISVVFDSILHYENILHTLAWIRLDNYEKTITEISCSRTATQTDTVRTVWSILCKYKRHINRFIRRTVSFIYTNINRIGTFNKKMLNKEWLEMIGLL